MSIPCVTPKEGEPRGLVVNRNKGCILKKAYGLLKNAHRAIAMGVFDALKLRGLATACLAVNILFLAVVCTGTVLAGEVLVEKVLLHRNAAVSTDCDLEYLGVECHVGYVLEHDRRFN